MLPALDHIGPEVRSVYSVDDKTCLLAGAEQEGLAHNPCATQGPSPLRLGLLRPRGPYCIAEQSALAFATV